MRPGLPFASSFFGIMMFVIPKLGKIITDLGGPDAELPAPIVLSAWGAQLQVDELPSTDAEAFLQTFRQGRTAPEPGAPCTGGASG